MRYLNVDLDELAFALDFRPEGMNHYLDLESGQVVSVSEESRDELERLYAGIEPGEVETPPPLEQLLKTSPLPDWQKEEVRQAAAVEAGYGTRFVAIPCLESWESYGDMQDFIVMSPSATRACANGWRQQYRGAAPSVASRMSWSAIHTNASAGSPFIMTA
jgi:hypothetical protein